MNAKSSFKGRNAAYQTILYRNVQALANFIMGKGKPLGFDVPCVAIRRDDTLDMKQCILAMTPDERKRLGINKSTLWYKKKQLIEGMPLKIYRKVSERLL